MSKYPLLDEYVKKTRAQGFSDDDIKKKILSSGYTQTDVDELFVGPVATDSFQKIQVNNPVSYVADNPVSPVQVISDTQVKTETEIKVNIPQSSDVKSEPMFTVNNPKNLIGQTSNSFVDDTGVKITEDAPASSDFVMPSNNVIRPNNAQFVTVPKTPETKSGKPFLLMTSLLIFVLLIGGGVYAYINDINPFVKNHYTEENFLTSVFSNLSNMDSANYVFYTKAYMQDHDQNKASFPGVDELEQKEMKFKRDIHRAHLLSELFLLTRYTGNDLYPSSLTFAGAETFREERDIEEVIFNEIKQTYKQLNSGNGYEVEIRFETEEAAKELQTRINFELEREREMFEQYDQSAPVSSFRITFNGTQVIINNPNGDYGYFRVGYALPKTFTQELLSMISSLSPEFNSDVQFDIKTESTQTGIDAALGVSLTGDMGDLVYKFSADFIKKQNDIFVRLNNFPSILNTFVSIPKAQWIMTSTKETIGFVSAEQVGEEIDIFANFQKDAKEILIESLKIANEQKIIKFTQKPVKEVVDNINTYKYSLRIDETKLITYITSVIEHIKNKESLIIDEVKKEDLEELLVKIKEPQFMQELQALIQNSVYFVWIDKEGYPVKFESKFVLVPSQKNEVLKGKQFVIDAGLLMKNINVPVQITTPSSYVTLKEIMEDIFAPMSDSEIEFE